MEITDRYEKLSVTGLKSDYIQIVRYGNISFGGCQDWFENEKNGGIIKTQGCGLIAISDIILYLAGNNDKYSSSLTDIAALSDPVDYKRYLEFVLDFNSRYVNLETRLNIDICFLRHKILSIHTNNIDGKMGKILNNYFCDNNIGLSARWGITDRSVYCDGSWFEKGLRLKRIKRMLSNNIPAVISVGPGMIGKMDGINCYETVRDNDSDKITYKFTGQKIVNHYFTVTAVIEDKEKAENGDFDSVMYEISSWGRKYYVAESEIRRFSRYNTSLFTNVLYIEEKV